MRMRGAAGLMALTLALGACAGSQEGEAEDPAADIRVVNELRPTTALTVHLVEGPRKALLGTVVPSGRRTFRVHPADLAATFRLEAETGSGGSITSPTFALRKDARVEWNVEDNTVTPD